MLPARYFKFVFSFIMALFMSFVISGFFTLTNIGFTDGFSTIWIINWLKALVIAYPCILIITPFATIIAKILCKK